MRKIEMVTHYDYAEDGECAGDYRNVTITIDNVVVATYGDYYHEKGHLCARAFVDGAIFAYEQNGDTCNLTVKNVADH